MHLMLVYMAINDLLCCTLQIMWAVCVYIEAVSVLPQLRMMQKAKVVEKFTAHYVFALGVSRFISCAHWILQIVDGDSFLLQAIGSGIWPAMVLLSEVVQTGILADFWYDVVVICFVAAQCCCRVLPAVLLHSVHHDDSNYSAFQYRQGACNDNLCTLAMHSVSA